jgi:hypothetical protein
MLFAESHSLLNPASKFGLKFRFGENLNVFADSHVMFIEVST